MCRISVKCLFLCLLGAGILCSANGKSSGEKSVRIYVATNGSDSARGDESHPLASLRKAKEMAATLKKVPVEIIIRPGEYTLTQTLKLTSEDSRAEDAPLTIRGAGMGETVISGGIPLPPFTDRGDGVWMSDLSDIMPLGGEISQLWVGDRRATMACEPNGMELFETKGCHEVYIDSLPNPRDFYRNSAGHLVKAPDQAAEALAKIVDGRKLKAEFYHKWDISRWPIHRVIPERNSLVVFGQAMPSWNNLGSNESQFKILDDQSLLDYPGEYYFNDLERVLYYIPRSGEEITSVRAVAPAIKTIISFDGVQGIRFENLSIRHSAYRDDWRGHNPEQAAASVDAAIMLDSSSGINFTDCEIASTGNCGIWFRHAVRDCSLLRCYIHDLGVSGVKIGSPILYGDEQISVTAGITVDNCIIREGSRNLATGVGVHILHAKDSRITHNEIADFYYSGVSVGWVWGYSHSYASGNKVNFNHIHHLGWGLLSDMGGIYTLGAGEGEEARGNVIHHVYSYGYGGWGLYTDEGSSGVLMENNLVYYLKSSGFHQHYGKGNIIRNNIFYCQLDDQIANTRIEDHLSFTFTGNIVCYSSGSLMNINWRNANSLVDRNLYWKYGDGKVSFDGMGLDQWKETTGKDKRSLVADPLFTDPDNGDFTIRNTKAIRKIGFKPFDYSSAGVYGSQSWKDLASFNPDRAAEYDARIARLRGRK